MVKNYLEYYTSIVNYELFMQKVPNTLFEWVQPIAPFFVLIIPFKHNLFKHISSFHVLDIILNSYLLLLLNLNLQFISIFLDDLEQDGNELL